MKQIHLILQKVYQVFFQDLIFEDWLRRVLSAQNLWGNHLEKTHCLAMKSRKPQKRHKKRSFCWCSIHPAAPTFSVSFQDFVIFCNEML